MLKRRQNFLIMTSTWNLFFFALLFREFFYIQMEKYARQALSEGVKSDTELHVSEESELYRVLNVHYNRNNHIEVSSTLFSFHKIRRRTLYKLSYMTMKRFSYLLRENLRLLYYNEVMPTYNSNQIFRLDFTNQVL